MICKGKYGFLALVSKVGNKHMHRIKRWIGTHTCARLLNNSSTNSKWVANTVAVRMTSSGGVKLCDIVFEIKNNCYVGINTSMA